MSLHLSFFAALYAGTSAFKSFAWITSGFSAIIAFEIKRLVREMTEARHVANRKPSQVEKAYSYQDAVTPYMEAIREHIDHLELEIDDEIWPLPKYRELLFTK